MGRRPPQFKELPGPAAVEVVRDLRDVCSAWIRSDEWSRIKTIEVAFRDDDESYLFAFQFPEEREEMRSFIEELDGRFFVPRRRRQ